MIMTKFHGEGTNIQTHIRTDVQKACQRGSAAELLNSTRITEFTYFNLELVVCFSEQ